jgi:hypothetical protein
MLSLLNGNDYYSYLTSYLIATALTDTMGLYAMDKLQDATNIVYIKRNLSLRGLVEVRTLRMDQRPDGNLE